MTGFRSRRAALAVGFAGMTTLALGRPRLAIADDASDLDDAATVLMNDGHFTQWLSLVDYADMAQRMRHPRFAYTAFVPTDDAFARYPYAVKNLVGQSGAPSHADPFDLSNIDRVTTVLRTHVVSGLHPAAEFSGKKVTLTNLVGTPIEIDGTNPQDMTIAWTYAQPSIVPVARANGRFGGTPIAAYRSLVYPVNQIALS